MPQPSIKPKRSRGQNFLIDKNILAKIVKAADLSPDDVVVEVGAGTGVLTKELAAKAKAVIAVEIDKDLIGCLQNELKDFQNVTLIKDDILSIPNNELLDHCKLKAASYKLVANIPYNITSRLLRKFLEEEPKPTSLLLLVQKEVAERIVATKGKMSLLSLAVQYFAEETKLLFAVSRNCFYPKPKVESALLSIKVRTKPLLSSEQEKLFFTLIKHGFSSKRKKLISNLVIVSGVDKEMLAAFFKKEEINENVRAEDFPLDDWLSMTKFIFP